MRRPRTRDLVFLPGQLVALAVPFVPFTDDKDVLPILGICDCQELPWTVRAAMLFGFLLVPLLALGSTIRQAIGGPLGRGEAWVAYGVSMAALAATALLLATVRYNVHPSLIGSALIWSIGAIAILASTTKSRIPRTVHAHVALLVAYVPSVGFFCVRVFGWMWQETGLGCWLASAAVMAYAVEAVVRVRRALRSERVAEAATP